MAELGNPRKTIEILNKYHFVFQKKYGQNFLIDTHVLDKIIKAAEITKDDMVLEIGPGIGTMTQYLCEAAREVVAIEIDKALIPILQEDTLSCYKNITILQGDILKFDVKNLIKEKNNGKPVKVVANLPYYITTPIIMNFFEENLPISNITVMVQKEVAERMHASPGTKEYGAFSLAVQYHAVPYLVANVPQNCFMPRPNVASSVIRLTPHIEKPVQPKEEILFFHCIRAAFNQRRKTLVNALCNAENLSFTKEQVMAALEVCGLDQKVRGEVLSLAEFARLADEIGVICKS